MTSDRAPLLRPSRWPALVGLLLITVGCFMPWQTVDYTVGARVVTTGADGSAAPGLQILLFAAMTIVAVGLRAMADSQTRLVQLLPFMLGFATIVLALEAYQTVVPNPLDPFRPSDVRLELGVVVVVVGSCMLALDGLLVTVLTIRSNGVRKEPGDGPIVDRAGWIGGAAGLLVGVVLFYLLTRSIVAPPTTTLFVALACACGGSILGFTTLGWIGVAIAHRGRNPRERSVVPTERLRR